MKNVEIILNIDSELWSRFRSEAGLRGSTITNAITIAIENWLNKPDIDAYWPELLSIVGNHSKKLANDNYHIEVIDKLVKEYGFDLVKKCLQIAVEHYGKNYKNMMSKLNGICYNQRNPLRGRIAAIEVKFVKKGCEREKARKYLTAGFEKYGIIFLDRIDEFMELIDVFDGDVKTLNPILSSLEDCKNLENYKEYFSCLVSGRSVFLRYIDKSKLSRDELIDIVKITLINDESAYDMCLEVIDFVTEDEMQTILVECIDKNPYLIKYIKNKTDDICKIAIEEDYRVISYIDNPSIDLLELAVKINIQAYLYTRHFFAEQERHLVSAIIANKKNNFSKQLLCKWKKYFSEQSINMFLSNCPELMCECFSIDELSNDNLLVALNANGQLIKVVPESRRNKEMIIAACSQCPRLIPKLLQDDCDYKAECYYAALNTTPEAVKFVPKDYIHPKYILPAIRKKGYLIQYIPREFVNEELMLVAVEQKGNYLGAIENPPLSVCIAAVKFNALAMRHVPLELKEAVEQAIKNEMQ